VVPGRRELWGFCKHGVVNLGLMKGGNIFSADDCGGGGGGGGGGRGGNRYKIPGPGAPICCMCFSISRL